jgi:type IV pilus assembly protein PilA
MHELLSRLAARRNDARDRGEQGFTLIELMVVVLIIAILIAIAIPTFLGARQKAQDRAAQSNLRNALTAVKTAYVDTQDYTTGNFASIEPSLTWEPSGTGSSAQGQISAVATGPDTIVLAAKSASGKCWYIKDDTGASGTSGNPGTFYASGAPGSGGCSGSDPAGTGATATSW